MASRKRTLSQALSSGGRFHFDDPTVDQLLAMVLTLSGEVWAQRERLAALESIAVRKALIDPDALDRHSFTGDEEARLAELRKEFLAALFGILENSRPPAGRASRSAAVKGGARARSARSKRGAREKSARSKRGAAKGK